MINEFKKYGRKRSCPVHPGICQKRLRKTKKHLSHASRSPDRDLSPGPPKEERVRRLVRRVPVKLVFLNEQIIFNTEAGAPVYAFIHVKYFYNFAEQCYVNSRGRGFSTIVASRRTATLICFVVFLGLPRKLPGQYLKLGHDPSFHILSNSLFINHPIIRR
jgi:hypothetical protein